METVGLGALTRRCARFFSIIATTREKKARIPPLYPFEEGHTALPDLEHRKRVSAMIARDMTRGVFVAFAFFAVFGSSSAFACARGGVSVDQYGDYNKAAVDARGCHSISVRQAGEGHVARSRSIGRHNEQVLGQFGSNTHVETRQRGRHLKAGVLLSGRGTTADVSQVGRRSRVGIISSRDDGHVRVRTTGTGNEVAIRQR